MGRKSDCKTIPSCGAGRFKSHGRHAARGLGACRNLHPRRRPRRQGARGRVQGRAGQGGKDGAEAPCFSGWRPHAPSPRMNAARKDGLHQCFSVVALKVFLKIRLPIDRDKRWHRRRSIRGEAIVFFPQAPSRCYMLCLALLHALCRIASAVLTHYGSAHLSRYLYCRVGVCPPQRCTARNE